jgi:hypothetical protein
MLAILRRWGPTQPELADRVEEAVNEIINTHWRPEIVSANQDSIGRLWSCWSRRPWKPMASRIAAQRVVIVQGAKAAAEPALVYTPALVGLAESAPPARCYSGDKVEGQKLRLILFVLGLPRPRFLLLRAR